VNLDSPQAERVLACVRAIPPGFVRTYGDCSPGAPRVVGAVLAALTDEAVPWHRVVRREHGSAPCWTPRVFRSAAPAWTCASHASSTSESSAPAAGVADR
jgi:alkylated DNA nucleotide flippase Atl1